MVTTTRNLRITLNFAKCDELDQQMGLRSVVFVILMQNYTPFGGIRLSNDNFSAYTYEQDIVLKEGLELLPIELEEITVENKAAMFADYNEKQITLIYLYNKW